MTPPLPAASFPTSPPGCKADCLTLQLGPGLGLAVAVGAVGLLRDSRP